MLLLGAWPVLGFMGLDVWLLWFLFKRSYLDARRSETLLLTDRELIVDRVAPDGEREQHRLDAYWLRVELLGEDSERLVLVSRGNRVVIGRFLAPPSASEVAEQLKAAPRRHARAALRARLGLKPQHVLHAVEAGLLACKPLRGTHRARGIGLAAERAMAELQPLAGGGEHHRVHADLLAAAQGGEADLAGRPRAGMAVAALAPDILELDLRGRRRRRGPAPARSRRARRSCGDGASPAPRCRSWDRASTRSSRPAPAGC